jgi:hypothetical protein
MAAGERMDFVPIPESSVTTSNQSFYVRVRGLNDCDDLKNSVFQTAQLIYDNARPLNPNKFAVSYGRSIRSGVVSKKFCTLKRVK